jgi:hypothetical protein
MRLETTQRGCFRSRVMVNRTIGVMGKAGWQFPSRASI